MEASTVQCGRIMVGSGTDTYDPLCELPTGHDGPCRSTAAIDQYQLGLARCTEPYRMRDGRWYFWDRKLNEPVEGFATRIDARAARRERATW